MDDSLNGVSNNNNNDDNDNYNLQTQFINNNCYVTNNNNNSYHRHTNVIKNNESYEKSWKIISEKVLQILKHGSKAKMIFEPLYSSIYHNVCDGYSERMHVDLIAVCSRHLNDVKHQLCSPDEFSVGHLLSVSNHLKDYLSSVKNVTSVFSYLNKFYVLYYLNTDLGLQLGALFNQIIVRQRVSILMYIVEESLKVPFSFPPGILHRFFNDLNQISGGEYSLKYPHLFSRYCVNVLPTMKESDLESHIAEVKEFQQRQRYFQRKMQEKHGLKRPAEEEQMKLLIQKWSLHLGVRNS